MSKFFEIKWLPYVILTLLATALYGQFLTNPIIFDDLPFFMSENDGSQPIDAITYSMTRLRAIPYLSLAWTKAIFGSQLPPFRIGNLLLHVANVVLLFVVVKTLIMAVGTSPAPEKLSVENIAFLTAALFAVHPIATYATGYLVQRSILAAQLFALLALWAYTQGEIEEKEKFIWLSAILYYFSVFSKEHSVTLIGIFPMLTILLNRDWTTRLKRHLSAFGLMLLIAGLAVAAQRGIIGSVYEVDAKDLLGINYGALTYPYSILTQMGLFFKYVSLWLLPDINQMSIDMREPFVVALKFSEIANALLFCTWGAFSAWLLFKRSFKGLIGFILIFPWLMFATELTTVRVQEPFVLYRSYLWFPIFLTIVPLMLSELNKSMVNTIGVASIALLTLLSMERLMTMSTPILVWNDAKNLVEKNPNVLGADRIYYNLSRHLLLNDMLADSEINVNRAIEINPNLAQAYAIRGAIHNKRHEWSRAIEAYTTAREINLRRDAFPSYVYLMGRAQAYEGAGKLRLAADDYLEACRIDFRVCENLRKNATQQ